MHKHSLEHRIEGTNTKENYVKESMFDKVCYLIDVAGCVSMYPVVVTAEIFEFVFGKHPKEYK